jgi:hypothetical protein
VFLHPKNIEEKPLEENAHVIGLDDAKKTGFGKSLTNGPRQVVTPALQHEFL